MGSGARTGVYPGLPRGAVGRRTFKRGLYPLVAKLMLVALMLIAVIAMVTYVHSLVTSTREYFELGPRLYASHVGLSPTPTLVIYVRNEGARSETILRIEIVAGGGRYVCGNEIVIEAGFRGFVVVGDEASLSHGVAGDKVVPCEWEVEGTPEIVGGHSYLVRLYTAQHGLMAFVIRCEEL